MQARERLERLEKTGTRETRENLTTHPVSMGMLVGWEEIGTCRPDA